MKNKKKKKSNKLRRVFDIEGEPVTIEVHKFKDWLIKRESSNK
jgi:hypothetical protein